MEGDNNTTPAKPLAPNQFDLKGTRYEITIPKFNLGEKKSYTAAEAAADAAICAKLVKLASEGPDGKRDEADFEQSGILKIVY